ncbi:MAG: UDP-N-acetylglucosamine--N-acetylmuramyl-(pentapeptide) pyrophosphoryl-undecaprenol N-acetylglucosamine transferase [Candidatus Aenigmarchaeota archaeon]|nr:UDP-N-acetylglucosamine--N-acetylmuramyl-(pentapeptide) pyrophosphoryl-undecaprenol N-acetylglucosamine transferase [Candidatus Aenigmarchaeota archaeon]
MNVYFSCNGLGLGHVGRSLTIAEELKKQGHCVVFGTWGPAVDYARKEGYKCYSLNSIDWVDNSDGSIDFLRTFLNFPKMTYSLIKNYVLEKDIIKNEKIDFVFSDSAFGHIAARIKGITSVYITHQITLPRVNKYASHFFEIVMYFLASFADKLVVCDFKKPNNLYPASVSRYSKTRYIGPLVRKYPKDYNSKEEIKKKIGVNGKLCAIFISGPKQSPYALEKRIVALEDEFLKMKKWNFIIRVKTKRKSRGNIKYTTWIDDPFELISAADVIVSRAGFSTVCDIMCFGKKSILIPQPKQMEQEALGAYLEDTGGAYNLPQTGTKKIPKLIEKLDSDESVEQKSLEYKKLFLKKDIAKTVRELVC